MKKLFPFILLALLLLIVASAIADNGDISSAEPTPRLTPGTPPVMDEFVYLPVIKVAATPGPTPRPTVGFEEGE